LVARSLLDISRSPGPQLSRVVLQIEVHSSAHGQPVPEGVVEESALGGEKGGLTASSVRDIMDFVQNQNRKLKNPERVKF